MSGSPNVGMAMPWWHVVQRSTFCAVAKFQLSWIPGGRTWSILIEGEMKSTKGALRHLFLPNFWLMPSY